MPHYKRRHQDELVLSDKGYAVFRDRICTFERMPDGSWEVSEDCDGYYGSTFRREEMIAFARWLLQQCGEKANG